MSAQSKDQPKITVYAKDGRLTTTSCLKAHEQINLMITDLYNLTYLLQINFCIDSVAIEMHKFFGVVSERNSTASVKAAAVYVAMLSDWLLSA